MFDQLFPLSAACIVIIAFFVVSGQHPTWPMVADIQEQLQLEDLSPLCLLGLLPRPPTHIQHSVIL